MKRIKRQFADFWGGGVKDVRTLTAATMFFAITVVLVFLPATGYEIYKKRL